MLHFLLQNNKKKMALEYIFRVSIILLGFIVISSIILVTLLLPPVFFTTYKNKTISGQLDTVKVTYANKDDDPALLIKKVNQMAMVLSDKNINGLPISDIIERIISLKNKNIKIINIKISEQADLSKKIEITGISNSRDDLMMFDKNLQGDGLFYNIDLPISSFIKNTDIDFTIGLIVKPNVI